MAGPHLRVYLLKVVVCPLVHTLNHLEVILELYFIGSPCCTLESIFELFPFKVFTLDIGMQMFNTVPVLGARHQIF
jgi:hypothetical protein